MRCFIALDLPEPLKEECVRLQNELKPLHLFRGNFTEEDNLHLTLKFLGEIDASQVEATKEHLRAIALSPCEAILEEVGVFSQNYMRIIWARLTGVDHIQKAVDVAVHSLFPQERRFMSHITLARVKAIRDDETKEELLDTIFHMKGTTKAKIASFALYQSILKREGPTYVCVERFMLKKE